MVVERRAAIQAARVLRRQGRGRKAVRSPVGVSGAYQDGEAGEAGEPWEGGDVAHCEENVTVGCWRAVL